MPQREMVIEIFLSVRQQLLDRHHQFDRFVTVTLLARRFLQRNKGHDGKIDISIHLLPKK
jgi:hypothetical protein